MQNDTCNRSTWGYNIELPDSRLEIRGEGEKDRDRDKQRERGRDRECFHEKMISRLT